MNYDEYLMKLIQFLFEGDHRSHSLTFFCPRAVSPWGSSRHFCCAPYAHSYAPTSCPDAGGGQLCGDGAGPGDTAHALGDTVQKRLRRLVVLLVPWRLVVLVPIPDGDDDTEEEAVRITRTPVTWAMGCQLSK